MAVLANDRRLLRHTGRALAWPISLGAVVETLALSAIVILSLELRLTPLRRGLTFDELFTAVNFVGAESAWKTASTSINFNNHVGYSLMARLAVDLIGPTDWALRLPALLLGLASLPALWWLVRPLVGSRLALTAALALALAPEHIRWSTSARGYSAMLLGVLLASGLLFHLLRQPDRLRAALFGLVTVLTVYVHLYAVSVVGVQAVLLLMLAWRARHDAAARRAPLLGLGALVAAGLLTGVLYLPIVPSLLASIEHAGRGQAWPDFPWVVATELTGTTPAWLVAAALLVASVGVVKLGRGRPLIVGYGLAVGIVPVAAATLVRPSDLYPRFFFFVLPFLLVAVVVGGASVPALLHRLLPGAPKPLTWLPALVGIAVLLASWAERYPLLSSDEGFRDAARVALTAPTDHVTLCAAGAGAELFRWYVPQSLTLPKTVAELQRATPGRTAAWCLYRPSSWESRASAEIRRYIQERGTVERFGDVLLLREGTRQ